MCVFVCVYVHACVCVRACVRACVYVCVQVSLPSLPHKLAYDSLLQGIISSCLCTKLILTSRKRFLIAESTLKSINILQVPSIDISNNGESLCEIHVCEKGQEIS